MAATTMTNLSNILKLKPTFWKKLAGLIRTWIEFDMQKGFVQLLTGKTNYNPTYAKYKANYMNRFTTRTYKTGEKTNKGTKLKAYSGMSIKSNSQTPNMYLTGRTINGLEYKNSTDSFMTIGYQEKDADKIIGNEALGRFITTLNESNQTKALKSMENEFAKNIKEWERGKIIIRIGK